MRMFVLVSFVLTVGRGLRLMLLATGIYPRARASVKSWEDMIGLVSGLLFALWAGALLWGVA